MRLLYSFGILIYTLGVRVAALFNPKARLMVAGWRASRSKIWDFAHAVGSQPIVWFHAASLGEFEQTRPVLEKFRQQHLDYKVLLTFFSPSGYEVRKNYVQADCICYLPMDTPSNARWLVQTVCPRVAFFVKYDFWFNYLEQLRRHSSRTYIFSAIFRPKQYFFRWYGGWYRRQLKNCYFHIFVQNEQSLRLLKGHGIEHCSLAGDTRFDRVHDIALAARRFSEIESFIAATHEGGNAKVLMAGSSWEPDETFLKQYFDHRPDLKYILAPHVISESHLNGILSQFGIDNCLRYSQLSSATADELKRPILIIDNIGMLSSLYRYADVAYIGGAWGRGLHNTLEAVTFGKPVVFGPNYKKFQEAHDLLSLGGGFTYTEYPALQQILDQLFNNEECYARASQTCLGYLNENLGSSDIILSRANI